MRFVHTFGAAARRGSGGRGGGRGGGGGGRGGRGGPRRRVEPECRRSTTGIPTTRTPNPFPTLGGEIKASAWDVPVGYSFTKGGMLHSMRFAVQPAARRDAEPLRVRAEHRRRRPACSASRPIRSTGAHRTCRSARSPACATSTPAHADRSDDCRSATRSSRRKGRQTLRFGGDYRDIHADSRTDANARGSFVFTGLYTGVDFGDFLLGLPQQATVQFGPGARAVPIAIVGSVRAGRLARQRHGDGQRRPALRVLLAGVGGVATASSTLDVAPGFTAAAPVRRRRHRPVFGRASRHDRPPVPRRLRAARRRRLARCRPATVVRAGYGINYNASVYQTIAQQLAAQPPFAVTDTVLASRAQPLPLETALRRVAAGVDDEHVRGRSRTTASATCRSGTSTCSAISRAPSTSASAIPARRAATSTSCARRIAARRRLRIPGVAAVHLGVVGGRLDPARADRAHPQAPHARLRARARTYTLSKSIDDASSIGGGGAVVAQNDQDLAAERGLSSFDQRHRFTGDFTYELPFGATKRWLQQRRCGGAASATGRSTAPCSWRRARRSPRASLGDVARRRQRRQRHAARQLQRRADRDRAIRRRRSSSTPPRSRFPRPARSATPAATRSSVPARR